MGDIQAVPVKVYDYYEPGLYQLKIHFYTLKTKFNVFIVFVTVRFYSFTVAHMEQIPITFRPIKKGRFCNNIEIYTLISKQLSTENKAKLSRRCLCVPRILVCLIVKG